MVTLTVLFLMGCMLYGYADVHAPFGGVRFTQNLIMVPAIPGVSRSTLPFTADGEPELELLFAPNHPRPDDMPDSFTFDWTMVDQSTQVAAVSGRIQFSGERVRRDPMHPPIAIVPLPLGIDGTFVVTVTPLEVGDWPDLEFYLVRDSDKRLVGFTLAGIFWSVFLALLAVVVRRQRAAIRAWKRIASAEADRGAGLELAPSTAGRSDEATGQ